MIVFQSYRYSLLIISFIAIVIVSLTQCMEKTDHRVQVISNAAGQEFAGSASCRSCHKSIYDSHIHTAHFNTSSIASDSTIKGSLAAGKNRFNYDQSRAVAIEKRSGIFYQVEYKDNLEQRARRMDIVIGSGSKGQSFIGKVGQKMFQLPITYFTAAQQWSNSPGYPDKIIFNRPITSRCLECHSTYAKVVSEPGAEIEAFDQLIYGVDCEKCHGPGATHVLFQQQHPQSKEAKWIVNPAHLSRQQQLDLCASCHGGKLQKTIPSFSFQAGDKLSDFYIADTSKPDPEKIDVHGNQYGLLRASKCFRYSDQLTCNTCHDSHQNERGNTTIFSARCVTCHDAKHGPACNIKPSPATGLNANCIDCHMPLQQSHAIAVKLEGQSAPTAALIRSHYIAIYKNGKLAHADMNINHPR